MARTSLKVLLLLEVTVTNPGDVAPLQMHLRNHLFKRGK